LDCEPQSESFAGTTWTAAAGAYENLPVNDVTWYQAYAFCIWDGGFLPSEAEWNFAASGGSEQRVYPWSTPPDSTTVDCSYANYTVFTDAGRQQPCVSTQPLYRGFPNNVGSESPKGDGKWGQADLARNVYEWTLDAYEPYVDPCTNAAPALPEATGESRRCRGGLALRDERWHR
jgi:formylglycine-generating enzyme required for sulfatase activity